MLLYQLIVLFLSVLTLCAQMGWIVKTLTQINRARCQTTTGEQWQDLIGKTSAAVLVYVHSLVMKK